MKVEAFRILIRRIFGETPQEVVIGRALELGGLVKKVLKPLNLGSRLQLDHSPDDQTPPCEWLVVSIEPSGQQDLFQDFLLEWERDLEAEREAGAALGLAKEAINLLRRLSEIARLTPIEFFKIIGDMDARHASMVGLTAGPQARESVLVRDPAGRDLIAPSVVLPQRVTLQDPFEITFKAASVGLFSAFIHLYSGNGRFYQRMDILHWGKVSHYKEYSRFFSKAMLKREELICTVIETVNSKGKVARYEWISTGA
jgi:hypothetical protein